MYQQGMGKEVLSWRDLRRAMKGRKKIKDITEHSQAEEALKASEERFRQMFDNMNNAVAVYEAVANGADFIFKDFNNAAERIEGVARQDLIGKSVVEVFPGVKEFGLFDVFQRVWRTGKSEHHPISLYEDRRIVGWRENFVYKLPSGEIVAIYDDVTRIKQAEESAQEAALRLKMAVHAANVGLWDWDLLTNKVYYLPEWKRQIGYEDWEITDDLSEWESMVHPDDLDRSLQTIRAFIEKPWHDYRIEFRFRHKDGSYRWTLAQASLLHNEDGKPIRMLGSHIDITERKQAEEEIRKLNEELEQRVVERTARLNEVNQELDAFAYSVSHDLRAPLRAMQGFSQALLEDYAVSLDTTGQDYARRIAASAEHLDRMILDLLAYSRLGRTEIKLGAISLKQIVAEAMKQLESEIQGKDANVVIDEPLPMVMAHPPILGQLVVNLLSNALKFIAPNMKPHVRLWAETRYETPEEQYVRLWVEDNGVGIEPEHQERIFRIFERLHGVEAYPGVGIGLAIVKKGVERMGGRIGMESTPGKGSRFWIELQKA
jgi:PAS domain S-box-containing protein